MPPVREVLEESDASGNMQEAYVFFGGRRIANRVVSSGAISYYAEDFIGSSRVITSSAGTTCYDADFYPYGAESNVTNTCSQNYKFTGKERDAETGNDDFDARYYSSTYGRFLSADWSAVPAPVPYANLTNPQTLNLYAIVRDNPESFADLDGHDVSMGDPGGTEGTNPGTQNATTDQKVKDKAEKAKETILKWAKQDQQKSQGQSPDPASKTSTRTPATGEPNSTEKLPGTTPGTGTERTYGPDGRAVKDVDYGHNHGAGDPHAHDWDWSKDPPRQPGRPLTPEEANASSSFSTTIKGFAHNHPVVTAVGVGVAILGAGTVIVISGGTAGPVVATVVAF